jgi:hypothetical protein
MCEKCVALDERIRSYREISASVTDERANTALNSLIAECEDEKLALHPPTEPRLDPR